MIRAHGIYPLGLRMQCLRGEFYESVKEYHWDGVDSTKYVGSIFTNILQFMSLLPISFKPQIHFRGTTYLYIQEVEFFDCSVLKLLLILIKREDLDASPSIRSELEVAVARRLIKFILKRT